jgi:hypothetical protein
VNAEVAHELERRAAVRERARTGALGARLVRARAIRSLGPLTMLAGAAWAVAQPARITLLHPYGQGFWWLLSEPPLFVVLVGALFHLVVAPGLLRDLEQAESEGGEDEPR